MGSLFGKPLRWLHTSATRHYTIGCSAGGGSEACKVALLLAQLNRGLEIRAERERDALLVDR